MRFGEWWSECLAPCRLRVHRDCNGTLKHRLRAVLCLLLYTHNSWANGISEYTSSLVPQEKQAWQTSAPQTSEGQS